MSIDRRCGLVACAVDHGNMASRARLAVLLAMLAMLASAIVLFAAAPTARAGTWESSWDFASGQALGWSLYSSQVGYYSASLTTPAGPASHGGGLWLYPTGSNSGSRLYTAPGNGPETYGGYALTAPGGSRIGAFTVYDLAHRDQHDRQMMRWSVANGTCFGCEIGYGEYFSTAFFPPSNHAVSAWPSTGSNLTLALNTTYCNPATDTTTRQGCPPALARPVNDPNDFAYLYASSVDVAFLDPDLPGLSYFGPLKALADGGWTNATGSFGLNIHVTDASSGVASASLYDDASVNGFDAFAPCDGSHTNPGLGALECPATYDTAFAADVSSLPDGTHAFTVSALDNSSEESSDSFDLNIDRTAPEVPDNATWHEQGGGARLEWDAADDAHAGVARYDWEASADGGATNCATGSTAGLTTPHVGTPCFASDGTRIELRVRAVDNAGNVGQWGDWTGGVTEPPTLSVVRNMGADSRPLADREWLRLSLDLSANATDSGSGVALVEFRLDGQAIGSCPVLTTDPFECPFNTASFDDGDHVLTVTVTDNAEIDAYQTTSTIPLRFDNKAPGAPPRPVAQTARDGVQIGWDAADALGGSPIDRYEYRYLTRSGAWSEWIETRSIGQMIDPPDVEVNGPAVEVRAYDVAGNVSGQSEADRGELPPPERKPTDSVVFEERPITPVASAVVADDTAATSDAFDDDDGSDDEYEAELAAHTPNRKRGCYEESEAAYQFGFSRKRAPGEPAGKRRDKHGRLIAVWYYHQPYADVPACRETTRQPLDKRKHFTDDGKGYAATNARVRIPRLNNSAIRNGGWPMRDSTGTIRLSVASRVNNQSLEEPYRWEVFSGDPATGALIAARNVRDKTPPFKLVGRACVSPVDAPTWPDNRRPSGTDDFLAVQLPSLDSKLAAQPIAEIGRPGLWGIVDRDAIRVGDLPRPARKRLNQAISKGASSGVTGCGSKHPLSDHETKPTVRFELSPVPSREFAPVLGFPASGTNLDVTAPAEYKSTSGRPDRFHPFSFRKHHRLGGSTWQRCDPLAPNESRNSACGSYAEDLTPPGAHIRVLTSATTGIGGGGLPMAFVPDNATVSVIRFVNYCDRNVSRGDGLAVVPGLADDHDSNKGTRRLFDNRSRSDLYWNNGGHAFWVYGRVINPQTPRPIYGWSPEPCSRLPDLRAAWATARRDVGAKLKPIKKARAKRLKKCNKAKKAKRAQCKRKAEEAYKRSVAKKVIKKPPRPKKKGKKKR